MTVTHQLNQLILLKDIVSRGNFPSQESIVSELEEQLIKSGYKPRLSKSTFLRYKKELEEEFDIEIKYDKQNSGYYIKEKDEDLAMLDSYLESFSLFNALKANRDKAKYIFPERHKPKGLKLVPDISGAIEKRYKVKFNYSKYSTDVKTDRVLEPYIIKESRTRWYVIGKDAKGDIKTFGLDRIENLQITKERFERDAKFDVEKKFEHSYGIYSSEEYPIEEIILQFDAEDGGYLKSVPLHRSQKIISENSDGLVIKLNIRLTKDFIMEILSRSWSLKVISPEKLRNEVCEIYEKALIRNKI